MNSENMNYIDYCAECGSDQMPMGDGTCRDCGRNYCVAIVKTGNKKWEDIISEGLGMRKRVLDWLGLSDSGLRLRLGEITSQEIRTLRAVLNSIAQNNNETP